MADPVDTLEGKCEAAFLALLSDAGIEELAQLMQGQESEVQSGSFVVVQCVPGNEAAFDTGNYVHKIRITSNVPADRDLENQTTTEDPNVLLRNLVQRIRTALSVSTLAADLSKQEEDFTVWTVSHEGGDSGFDGRFMWHQDEFDVDCVRADLE
jgi:hypothetical protein